MTPPPNSCCRKVVEAIFKTHTKEELATSTFTFQCDECDNHWESRGSRGVVTVRQFTPPSFVRICDIEAAPGSHPDNCLNCGWPAMQEVMV